MLENYINKHLKFKKIMKSYNQNTYAKGSLSYNKSKEGESLEQKIERIVSNKEPIKDGAPILYTERKEGVKRSTNIRTDRFEVAVEAADKIAKSYKAKREENATKREKPKNGEPEPIQGKDQKDTDKS